MKRACAFFMIFCLIASAAWGFVYEVKILTKEEIKKLQDDELLSVYIETMIEHRASEAFHGKAGFSPKEYKAFKDLLGFIVRLRQEMLERDLDVPPIEEWLK